MCLYIKNSTSLSRTVSLLLNILKPLAYLACTLEKKVNYRCCGLTDICSLTPHHLPSSTAKRITKNKKVRTHGLRDKDDLIGKKRKGNTTTT